MISLNIKLYHVIFVVGANDVNVSRANCRTSSGLWISRDWTKSASMALSSGCSDMYCLWLASSSSCNKQWSPHSEQEEWLVTFRSRYCDTIWRSCSHGRNPGKFPSSFVILFNVPPSITMVMTINYAMWTRVSCDQYRKMFCKFICVCLLVTLVHSYPLHASCKITWWVY